MTAEATTLNLESHGPEAQGATQLFSFRVGEQKYALDILRVQEIRRWEQCTKLPHAPEEVRGVINLRGAIVPVIDLRFRFGCEASYLPTTVIVIVRVQQGSKEKVVGVVVDAVLDVFTTNQEQIHDCPDIGVPGGLDFVKGMVKQAEDMLIVIDVDEMLGRSM
jgi:purine-binding chemotaxis protein CheW